jgi:predicted enzyme related to lactoylglutathione lyase
MLRGLTTVTFFATDLAAAKQWYTELLGTPPYFDRSGYFEFRLGDTQSELGILDAKYAPHDVSATPAGAIVYWAVDDVPASLAWLEAAGCTLHDKATERGPGYVTGSATDPFGNVIGVMKNVHWEETLSRLTARDG